MHPNTETFDKSARAIQNAHDSDGDADLDFLRAGDQGPMPADDDDTNTETN